MNGSEVGKDPAERAGSLGLGLSPEADAEVIKSIGIMFGMQIFREMRQEEREMMPEEGTE
ncbi:hypothetical protein [uncultured Tateyamaria sp.]|uniref:hypothetical protein n=1 Tax=uncultured Tateyamaria sp. TaxID=455651 RepID=UPI00261B777A|nr:hypothetical protein [uncultured Tateyamaria sp.]